MSRRPLRRAGAVWRLLVHEHETDGPRSEMAHSVQSDRVRRRDDTRWSRTVVLPRTEFDELVVGRFLHVEAMATGVWWMNIAGVEVTVTADRDGRPTLVRVSGPGDAQDPVDSCAYELDWGAQ